MKIYLDIVGTIVEQSDEKIGRVNFGCFEIIKKLQDAGHSFILNTSYTGKDLENVLQLVNEDSWMFFKDRRNQNFDLEIKPILDVVKEKIYPDNWDWEEMIKNQTIFIDDMSNNIPLKKCCMHYGNMVDWYEIDKQFIEHKLY